MNNSSNTPLGKKLLNLRKEYKMTQDDVAKILGMSRTSFSKYENGIANPPLQVLRKIAAIYNVGLEYLIFDENTVKGLTTLRMRTMKTLKCLSQR